MQNSLLQVLTMSYCSFLNKNTPKVVLSFIHAFFRYPSLTAALNSSPSQTWETGELGRSDVIERRSLPSCLPSLPSLCRLLLWPIPSLHSVVYCTASDWRHYYFYFTRFTLQTTQWLVLSVNASLAVQVLGLCLNLPRKKVCNTAGQSSSTAALTH